MTGRIFEIREFTLHDGPGVRTTVFFKGCPLRCAWCHNPEGQAAEIETMVRKGGEKVVCGRDISATELADELATNADIMNESGGGVTFSGGEPLVQAKFLLELCRSSILCIRTLSFWMLRRSSAGQVASFRSFRKTFPGFAKAVCRIRFAFP